MGQKIKRGSTEPDMPAYCKQGRKNEGDPDVDCPLAFSMLRNPSFSWKEEPRAIFFFAIVRPASRIRRWSHSTETPNHFTNRLHARGDFSRISTNFHRIIVIELIFSPPPSPGCDSRAGRSYQDRSNSFLPSIPPHLSSPDDDGVDLKSPARCPVAGDL
jgi:hypothetical protein